jgi:hypothetical protein
MGQIIQILEIQPKDTLDQLTKKKKILLKNQKKRKRFPRLPQEKVFKLMFQTLVRLQPIFLSHWKKKFQQKDSRIA